MREKEDEIQPEVRLGILMHISLLKAAGVFTYELFEYFVEIRNAFKAYFISGLGNALIL